MSCRKSFSPSSPMDFGDYLFNDDDEKLLSSLLLDPTATTDDFALVPAGGGSYSSANPDAEEDSKPPAIPRDSDLSSTCNTEDRDMAALRRRYIDDDFALAMEWRHSDFDDGCSSPGDRSVMDSHTTRTKPRGHGGEISLDFRLALQLQGEENEASMLSSYAGQAWKFVEEVLQLYRRHEVDSIPGFTSLVAPIGRDDLVFVAERFFQTIELFQQQGKPCQVDLGYHYTRSDNLERIRTDGLLSRHERESAHVMAHYNGSRFGDGIYLAKNPFAFHGRYGDVGLIAARLPGCIAGPADANVGFQTPACDSVQVHGGQRREFTVLKTCGQCLPIFQFKSNMVMPQIKEHHGNVGLFRLHEDLQSLLNHFINKMAPTGSFVQRNAGNHLVPEYDTNCSKPSASISWHDDPQRLFGSPNGEPHVLSGPMYIPRQEATRYSESSHFVPSLSNDRSGTGAPQHGHPPFRPSPCIKALYPVHGYSATVVPPSPTVIAMEQRPTTMSSQAIEGKRPPEMHFVTPVPLKKPKLVAFGAIPFKAPPTVIPAAAKESINANQGQPKLAVESTTTDGDDHLFRHVRQCTFSTLSEPCTVCAEILMVKRNGKMVQLHRCGHCFHENCLRSSLRQQSSPTRSCPSCSVTLDAGVVADAEGSAGGVEEELTNHCLSAAGV